MCEGMTETEQRTFEFVERSGPAVEKFRQAVQKWREWMDVHRQQAEVNLAIAETKPEGAKHRSGLYLDTEGRVWDGVGSGMFFRLVRTGIELFSPYRREGDNYELLKSGWADDGRLQQVKLRGLGWVEFFARSDDVLNADWGWEIIPCTSRSRPTAYRLRRSLERWQRGLDLADRILGCGHLTGFMIGLAETQGDARETQVSLIDQDWPGLLDRLEVSRGIGVPDNGSVLCALHAAIDQVACGRQVRTYGY